MKPKSDTRYLARRGQGWSFVMAVPRGLHGRFKSANGKPLAKIVIGLNTQSLAEAQGKRWPLVSDWQARFERAASNTPLTLMEIAIEGQEAHDFLLDRLAADSARGRYDGAPILGPNGEVMTYEEQCLHGSLDQLQEALEDEDWRMVSAEVQAIERRRGVSIEPGSETYARLARAILTGQVRAMGNHLRLLDAGRRAVLGARCATEANRSTVRRADLLASSGGLSCRASARSGREANRAHAWPTRIRQIW